jgi:hypothetical protein
MAAGRLAWRKASPAVPRSWPGPQALETQLEGGRRELAERQRLLGEAAATRERLQAEQAAAAAAAEAAAGVAAAALADTAVALTASQAESQQRAAEMTALQVRRGAWPGMHFLHVAAAMQRVRGSGPQCVKVVRAC